jgi:hypothetical protein
MPKLTHIIWRDAAYGLVEQDIAETGLIELHASGFVLREDDESITVSLEWQDGATTSRNWLAIPKNRIISRYDFRIPRARKA